MGKKTKKAPLVASDVFPPVELSREQIKVYREATDHILKKTVRHYEQFFHQEKRALSKKRWKPVKSRENVTVYKQRDEDTHADSMGSRSGSGQALRSSLPSVLPPTGEELVASDSWSLPMLLGVGTITGTLEDVMYGTVTQDTPSMRIKMCYIHEDMVDGAVLHRVDGPTEDDPFRFFGLKWFVKAHPAGLNAMVWPRDCVFMESCGIMKIKSGNKDNERIGYHLMHSVDIPKCRELSDFSIMRGRISSCALYRQLPDGTVDVYMQSLVQPHGKLLDSVAIISAAESLIGVWRTVACGQSKKLGWMLRTQQKERRQTRRRLHGQEAPSVSKSSRKHCGMCNKKIHAIMMKHGYHCEMCDWYICSRCKVTRRMFFEAPDSSIEASNVIFCKNCVYSSNTLNGFDVAQSEIKNAKLFYEPNRSDASLSVDSEASASRENGSSFSQIEEGEDEEPVVASLSPDDKLLTSRSVYLLEEELDGKLQKDSLSTLSSSKSPEMESSMTNVSHSPIRSPKIAASSSCGSSYPPRTGGYSRSQQDLWVQMNQLRNQAESIYQITKKNTENLRMHQPDTYDHVAKMHSSKLLRPQSAAHLQESPRVCRIEEID